MQCSGHIENGKVVLDDAVSLPEGQRVVVVLPMDVGSKSEARPLRGTPCRYDAPFDPAVPEEDWDALQ